MRLTGSFFKALSAKQLAGEIEIDGKIATITADGEAICKDVPVQSIQNRQDIYLENGYLFTLDTALDKQQESQLYGEIDKKIAWLEKFSLRRAVILSVLLISTLVIFRYSLTLITPFAVSVFPHEWEETIGQNTYSALNKAVFSKSELSPTRIQRLRQKSSELAEANGFEAPQILFHKSDLIGANAMAFPGGPIVVTDDLVLLLDQDDIVLSVIAHEFAHIQERHALQQIIEIVGIAALASVFLGADDTLIEEASAVGVNLWASKKSRAFEKEADLLAVSYLENANMGEAAFGTAIEKLTAHYCSSMAAKSVKECLENTQTGWLSSHPTGAERMEYLRSE